MRGSRVAVLVVVLVMVGWCVALVHARAQATEAEEATARRLARLIDAPGVAGREDEVRDAIAAMLPSWAKPRVDELGNLVLSLGPPGPPATLVVAPLDEDGYVVSGVTADGFLRLHRPGRDPVNRLFDQFHVGQPVLVQTRRNGAVAGVTATPSTHLRRFLPADEASRIRGLEDLWVDVGASAPAQVDQLGIRMLDAVTLRERAQPLAGGRVAGPAAQGRGNALTLVELVRGWRTAPVGAGPVTIAWMTQSVFGGRGLARLVESVRPQRIVLCGPVAPARGKDADPRGGAGSIGGGPIVAADDGAAHEAAVARGVATQDLAADRWVQRAPGGWTGTWQTLGVPVLYAQSPVETVDAGDVLALARLVAAVVDLPAPTAPTPDDAAALPAAAPSVTKVTATRPADFGVLKTLIETYGVSGHEEAVRDVVLRTIRQTAPWASPATDERGNVVVTFGKGGDEKVFLAHMDEIGYEIVSIRTDGTATLRARGGMYDVLYEAHPALVHTAKGRVPAVLAPRPGYAGAETAHPRPEDLTASFGAGTADEVRALGVTVGDTLTVRKQFVPLAGGRATGRSMDDRSGVAILLSALAKIDPARATGKTSFIWSVQEETGLAGARFIATTARPVAAFAVDTFVSTDGPFDTRRLAYAPLGQGAVLRGMDSSTNTSPALTDRLVDLARRQDIPMSIGVTSGGTDASPFSRYGAMDVGLSWPGRYSHSPVEVIDQRDFDAVIRMVVAVTTSAW